MEREFTVRLPRETFNAVFDALPPVCRLCDTSMDERNFTLLADMSEFGDFPRGVARVIFAAKLPK